MATAPAPAPGRVGRVVLRVVLVSLLLAVGGGTVWLLAFPPAAHPLDTISPAAGVDPAPVSPDEAVPGAVSIDAGQPAGGAAALSDWASTVSASTGVPIRALEAYGAAEVSLRAKEPGCHLGWNTLAGIGRIESNHGRFGGATLRSDGTESRAVIGVPLDGSPGVRDLPDTDRGVLDGDSAHDRAVGPMQFLPATWRHWADPGADPQNIDAAALAAARYLCANGRDLGTARGWWAGVLSYNDSVDYAQKVFTVADGYARGGAGR